MGTRFVETTLVVLVAITAGVLFLATGSTIPVFSLLFAMTAFLLGVASWRLHRGQLVSIDTMRLLRALDEGDRAQNEQRLRAHYETRERNIEQRHLVHVKGLDRQLAQIRSDRA
jgi:hypothetical protein